MIFAAPDPHPGRCLNSRPASGDPYRTKKLRCLRSEGHAEACVFDPPSEALFSDKYTNYSVYPRETPTSWEEPSWINEKAKKLSDGVTDE